MAERSYIEVFPSHLRGCKLVGFDHTGHFFSVYIIYIYDLYKINGTQSIDVIVEK